MSRYTRKFNNGYLVPTHERGPNDPTEYELASQSLCPRDLEAWVFKWWRTKYVPEDVLTRLGLALDAYFEPNTAVRRPRPRRGRVSNE